jgi:hypothetical protein
MHAGIPLARFRRIEEFPGVPGCASFCHLAWYVLPCPHVSAMQSEQARCSGMFPESSEIYHLEAGKELLCRRSEA